MFLYHYTNEENFNKILVDKILRKSPSGTNGRHGAGVYLTSLTPDKGRNKIKKNNYDGRYEMPQYADKTQECYLKFKKEDLDDVYYVQTKGGRDVWLNSNDINLRDISYYSGYTDYSDGEEYHPCVSVVAASAEAGVGPYSNHAVANPGVSERQSASRSTYGYIRRYEDSRSISYRSSQQQQQQSESDSDGDYSNWYSNNPAVSERHSAARSTYGYATGGDSRSTSYRSDSQQQQQQESDEIGLGGMVAGTAAVVAVGAAVFGLFAAFRQSRQNNE